MSTSGAPARRGWVLALALVLGAAALAFLLAGVPLGAVAAALHRQPPRQILAALGFTAASFACLACHDALSAAIVAKGRVPHRVALFAGAAGSAIANALGFHAVSGSAVRARIYMRAGLGGAEVARIASLSWLALLAGNAAMFAGAELAAGNGMHRAIGAVLAAALALFVGWLARGPRQLAVRGVRFPLPPASLALAQVAIGAVESAAAIAALYVLLPPDLAPPFGLFAAGCIVAVALGVVAHTPGGIGVFEASMTALLAGRGRADLLAALLLYRAIYGILPFALSVLALGAVEAGRRTGGVALRE